MSAGKDYGMKRFRRSIALIVAAIVLVSGLPLLNTGNAYAASSKTAWKKTVPKVTSAKNLSDSAITVKWKKVKGAKGYVIRYATNKKFKKAKSVTVKKSAESKTIKKLKAGKKYYVRVRAFKKSNGRKVYTKWSSTKTAVISFYKPVIKSVTANKKSIALKWKKVAGSTGYQIRYSTDESFSNPKTIKITSRKTVSKTITGLAANTKYYLRIRAVKKTGSKTKYTAWTKVEATTGENGSDSDDQSSDTDTSSDTDDTSSDTDGSGKNEFTLYIDHENIDNEVTGFAGKDFTADVNDYVSVSGSNLIKSVSFSDESLVQFDKNSSAEPNAYWFNISFKNVGVTDMTVTDEFGQKVTLKITIEDAQLPGVKKFSMDSSLPVPDVDTVESSPYYACANVIWPDEFPQNSNYGFQGCTCRYELFDGRSDFTTAKEQWNNGGYCKLSWFYVYGDQYIRVRAYRVEGDTVYFGPWSKTVIAREFDTQTPKSGKAQYDYELYFLSDMDTYTEKTRPVYLKTNNPDPNSFAVTVNGKSIAASVSIMGKNRYFDDVEYTCATDTDRVWQKVKGGYLGQIEVAEAGQFTVEVREYYSDGYIVASSMPLKVLNYEAERDKYMAKVIADNTDSSMNSLEKMDAVCEFLRNGQYRYLPVHNGERVSLASVPALPWFVVKRWDSATSPAMLQLFAEKIGGFENIHGGYDWDTHANAYATFEGEEHVFEVCPLLETGEVDYEMIDFTDSGYLYTFK